MRKECIEQFKEYLKREEKAGTTISKYVHDVNEMLVFMSHMELNKEALMSDGTLWEVETAR